MDSVAQTLAAPSILWALPFAGLLASIALTPLVAPRFWHAHFGKVAAAWAVAIVIPNAIAFGLGPAATGLARIAVREYLPFVLLLAALYVVTGGIEISVPSSGRPWSNIAMLALGTVLASVIGTTGASMLLIRPLLKANAWRRYRAHTVVFFIFLVSNIGGALTPIGDPPLFIGFLQGVPFFWTLRALGWPTLLATSLTLSIYAVLEGVLIRREALRAPPVNSSNRTRFRLDGALNLVLMLVVIATVIASGLWRSELSIFGVPLEDVVRDAMFVIVIAISWKSTPNAIRRRNAFTLAPIEEVVILFAAIFIAVEPVMRLLAMGRSGPFAAVVDLVQPGGAANAGAYFLITGLSSSLLDNAPTYLIFFQFAGGDAAHLSQAGSRVLAAISAGAVYMGALTYIGNAPNLMVRNIATEHGVEMPSFFRYIAWSVCVLGPVFALVGWLAI